MGEQTVPPGSGAGRTSGKAAPGPPGKLPAGKLPGAAPSAGKPAPPVWAADVERRVRQGRNAAVVASTIIALVVAALAVGAAALLREKPAETLVTAARAGSLAGGGVSLQVEYQEYQWQRGADPVRMIRKDEGFCYLTQIRGEFAGAGEQVRVYLGDDGFWYLHGNAQKPVSATATSVRFVSHPFTSAAFSGREGWPDVVARLAAGPDAPLRDLARAEQRGPPADAADRAVLAGLWTGAAEKVANADRPRLVSHAIELYEAAGPGDPADRLRRLRDSALNDLAQWRPQSGRWEATPDGKIRGVGNAALLFAHQLPRDGTLEFRMNVVEGLRPRVRFPGSGFYVGNEGYTRVVAPHGAVSVSGAGAPYRNGQDLKMAVKFAGDQFELSVDDKVAARGSRRTPPGTVGLLLEAGDWWGQGDVLFWGFQFTRAP